MKAAVNNKGVMDGMRAMTTIRRDKNKRNITVAISTMAIRTLSRDRPGIPSSSP